MAVPEVVGSSSCLALGWWSETSCLLASLCPPELEASFRGVRADLSLLVGVVTYSRRLSVTPPAVFMPQKGPQGPTPNVLFEQ